jgi:hypothetical protein
VFSIKQPCTSEEEFSQLNSVSLFLGFCGLGDWNLQFSDLLDNLDHVSFTMTGNMQVIAALVVHFKKACSSPFL